jgi:hypothetical protein
MKALRDDPHSYLLALMELANYAHPSDLPELGRPPDPDSEAANLWWEQRIAELDPRLRNYMDAVSPGIGPAYPELQEAIKVLRQVAAHRGDLKPGMELAQFQVRTSVRSDGQMVQIRNDLLDYCIFQSKPADRIRLCDCGNVFWAKRKDQPCCGAKCANARRVKIWREKYPEYKHQRYRRAEEQRPKR